MRTDYYELKTAHNRYFGTEADIRRLIKRRDILNQSSYRKTAEQYFNGEGDGSLILPNWEVKQIVCKCEHTSFINICNGNFATTYTYANGYVSYIKIKHLSREVIHLKTVDGDFLRAVKYNINDMTVVNRLRDAEIIKLKPGIVSKMRKTIKTNVFLPEKYFVDEDSFIEDTRSAYDVTLDPLFKILLGT